MRNKRDEVRESPAPQKTRVPRLRFPEFRDAEEWEQTSLGKFAVLVEDRVGDKKIIPLSITSGIGLVSQQEKFGRDISGQQYKNYIAIRKGDFAYNKSATKQYPEGYIALLQEHDEAAVPPSIFTCFRIKNDNIHLLYLKHIFHANIHGVWLRRFIKIGARAHGSLAVDSEDLFNLPLLLPSLSEQHKIAECLSSLDELISAHAKKLEGLKAYKKGLMQLLFPAEGEKLPRLRFPEFREGPEWEEKLFSQFISEMVSGVSINSHGYPVGVEQDIAILKTSCVADGVFIPEENKTAKESEAFLAKTNPLENTIIMSRMNTPLLVGECGYVQKDYPRHFLPDRLWRISCDEKEVVTRFFSKYLSSDRARKQLRSCATGTSASMKNISQSTFMNLAIGVPSILEQRIIASFLSSLENLVTVQSAKIDTLIQHKKALMQRLFPQAEEEES